MAVRAAHYGCPGETSVDTAAEVGGEPAGPGCELRVRTRGRSGRIFANQPREVTPGPSRPCGPSAPAWLRMPGSGPRRAERPGKQDPTEPRAAGADALWTPAAARPGTGRHPRPRGLPPARAHGGCANRAGAGAKGPTRGDGALPPPTSRACGRPGSEAGGPGSGTPGCGPGPPASRHRRTPTPWQRRARLPGAPSSLRSGPGKAGSWPRFTD